MTTHEELLRLLAEHHIAYRLCEHAAEGHSEAIAKIRGNDPHQAMKAIVILAKNTKKDFFYHLAVLPADKMIDLAALKAYLAVKKVIFAPLDKAREVSGCEIGAIPPFCFNPAMKLIVDPGIKDNEEIVFNAGLLTKSIFMKLTDYLQLVAPQWVHIAKERQAHA